MSELKMANLPKVFDLVSLPIAVEWPAEFAVVVKDISVAMLSPEQLFWVEQQWGAMRKEILKRGYTIEVTRDLMTRKSIAFCKKSQGNGLAGESVEE